MAVVMMVDFIFVQLDNGNGVGVGVVVTIDWSTESREAERLISRSNFTASRSGSSVSSLFADVSPQRFPCLIPPQLPPPPPLGVRPLFEPALKLANCTGPPSPTVTDSHFCRPLFFFFRLKKQQHLEIKQTLMGLRIVFY